MIGFNNGQTSRTVEDCTTGAATFIEAFITTNNVTIIVKQLTSVNAPIITRILIFWNAEISRSIEEVVDYIKKFTEEIETFRPVKPDIVFEAKEVEYAIEVETGKINNLKRLQEKVINLKKY